MRQNLINTLLFIVTVLILGAVYLKVMKPASNSTVQEEVTLPAQFQTFYEQFHQDSVYQVSKIVFPLKGISFDENGSAENVSWTKEEWKIHRRPQEFSQSFVVNFMMLNGIIIETTQHDTYAFSMERRFMKSDNSYNLIYYKEMGPQ